METFAQILESIFTPLVIVFSLVFMLFYVLISGTIRAVKNHKDSKTIEIENELPTFLQYVEKHPELKNKNGAACHKCGATNITMFLTCQSKVVISREHACKVCGTILWASYEIL